MNAIDNIFCNKTKKSPDINPNNGCVARKHFTLVHIVQCVILVQFSI